MAVLYHGGEPFLNKRFFEMLRRARQPARSTSRWTHNGMVLTDAMIEGVVRDGLDLMVFSTDGDNPKMKNFIRRDSKYETIVKNIKRMLDYKRKIGASKPVIKIGNARFHRSDHRIAVDLLKRRRISWKSSRTTKANSTSWATGSCAGRICRWTTRCTKCTSTATTTRATSPIAIMSTTR